MFWGAAAVVGVGYRIAHSDYSEHYNHANHSRYSDSNVLAKIEQDKAKLSQKRKELVRIKNILDSSEDELQALFQSEELLQKHQYKIKHGNVTIAEVSAWIQEDLEKDLAKEKQELKDIDDALRKIAEIELNCK